MCLLSTNGVSESCRRSCGNALTAMQHLPPRICKSPSCEPPEYVPAR